MEESCGRRNAENTMVEQKSQNVFQEALKPILDAALHFLGFGFCLN